MHYFISAWYPKDRPWYENSDTWYRDSLQHHLDDTIYQMRMFREAQQDIQLISLNYMPNLRYFTHHFGLFEVPYWNAFDQIQGIGQVSPKAIDFRQLGWPHDAEFFYNYYHVVVEQKGRKIARVEFGSSGQLIYIDRFKEGQLAQRYIFDDRGFLSSILFFQNGQTWYQEYYDTLGRWRIREDLLGSGRVEINPDLCSGFDTLIYKSMEDLIEEVYAKFAEHQIGSDDVVQLAVDRQHQGLVLRHLPTDQLILSFYSKRTISSDDDLFQLAQRAKIGLADKQSLATELSAAVKLPFLSVLPTDSRLSLGKSQRLKELEVYFVADGLSEKDLHVAFQALLETLPTIPNTSLTIVTYQEDRIQSYQETLEGLLVIQPEARKWVHSAQKLELLEEAPGEDRVRERVNWAYIASDREIMEALDRARLVLDLSAEPDQYTQIAAISAGLPQINTVETEYVTNRKNGLILASIQQLPEALFYYLNGLSHWNESLVNAVQKMTDYTSGRLVEKILSFIEKP